MFMNVDIIIVVNLDLVAFSFWAASLLDFHFEVPFFSHFKGLCIITVNNSVTY